MASVLDELIVKLGLDVKDVDAKAPGVRKKLDEIEKAGRGVTAGLAEMTGKLGAFLALLGGSAALTAFIDDAVKANTQLFFMSQNLGTGVRTLGAMGLVAKEFGGTAQGLQNTLSGLSMEATNFALTGQSRLIPFLSMMGVAFNQAHPQKMLEGMAQWAQSAMQSGASRPAVVNILKQMGIDQGTINAMMAGPKQYESYVKAMKAMQPTKAEAATAEQLNFQMAQLEARFLKIGYDLLQKASPALEIFFRLLNKVGAWIQAHETLAEIFVGVAVALGAVAAVLGTVAVAGAALGGVFAIIGSAFTAILSPLALVVAGIGALAAWALFDWGGLARSVSRIGSAFESVAGAIGRATASLWGWVSAHAKKLAGAIDGGSMAPGGMTAEDRGIATAEGFFKNGSIPQRANNPGDISYGQFAIRHGATGYLTAAGGKKIAVFPSAAVGWAAMNALQETSGYKGLSYAQKLKRWSGLSGKHLSDYMAEAQRGARSAAPAAASNRTVNNNVQSVNIVTRATDAKGIGSAFRSGTDWLFASQFNTAAS